MATSMAENPLLADWRRELPGPWNLITVSRASLRICLARGTPVVLAHVS